MIVANQTAPGPHLKEIVAERKAQGPCSFLLLVPVTPPKGTWTFTDDEALELASARMQEALAGLKDLDADIEGRVEVGAPFEAVTGYLDSRRLADEQAFDEIVLSTLAPGISRWLKQDLPHRLERHLEIPVTHVIGEQAPGSTV